MLSAAPASFHAQYQALVSSGAIEPDAAQARTVEAFAALEPYGGRAEGLKSVARYLVERKN